MCVSDGDLITIFDSSDLVYAVTSSRVLKLSITVPGQATPYPSLPLSAVRQELRLIRNRVTALLDQLGEVPPGPAAHATERATTPVAPVDTAGTYALRLVLWLVLIRVFTCSS